MASTALVLSIAAPFGLGGNAWYGLTSFSPLAGVYYLQKGNRQEEVRSEIGHSLVAVGERGRRRRRAPRL